MAQNITIADWKPLSKGALRGFVSVTLPSGLVLREVSILVTDGRPWASPPSKPLLDRDGRAMTGDDGRRRYSQIVEFTAMDIRDRWSDSVIEALRTVHPEAFDE
jgi:DNA-binding cell septation regulator SpoVG